MWDKAEPFLDGKVDVLVNNAGVSPKLGYDICMKVTIIIEIGSKQYTLPPQINLEGVMNGVQLYEEKRSKVTGGPGGLIINTASCAGLTHTK